MKVKILILIALLFSIGILQTNSLSLLSKYQTKEQKIKEIINDIVKSETDWEYKNLNLQSLTITEPTLYATEQLTISDFKYIAGFLSGYGLVGKYNIKEDHKNNTLEITSSNEMESVYDLSIGFNYNHTIVYSNQTREENVGKGIIVSKTKNFNITLVYAYPDYEVLHLVDVNLNFTEHTLEEENERIKLQQQSQR